MQFARLLAFVVMIASAASSRSEAADPIIDHFFFAGNPTCAHQRRCKVQAEDVNAVVSNGKVDDRLSDGLSVIFQRKHNGPHRAG